MRCAKYAALLTIMVAPNALAHTTAKSACAPVGADEQAITRTIHAFYEAERTGDTATWRALTTGDFYMFHEGVMTPPAAFAQWIDRQHAALSKDKAAWWTLDMSELRINVDCNTALTTQKLHNVSEAPTIKPGYRYDETFLESFWLRRIPKIGWRIAFWNVAKMPKETPSWAKIE